MPLRLCGAQGGALSYSLPSEAGRQKQKPHLGGVPEGKVRLANPKTEVVETRAWSDSRSKEMEPRQSGLNMGWRNRAPWKRMWKTESDSGWGKMATSLHFCLALS